MQDILKQIRPSFVLTASRLTSKVCGDLNIYMQRLISKIINYSGTGTTAW